MSTESTIRGSCNCGLVKVSIASNSFPKTSSLCHCLNCRASGGTLFAVNLPTPLVDVCIEGKPKIYYDVGESGNPVHRYFCGDCGSPIMTVLFIRPDTAFLKGGLFKKYGFELPPPGRQQFTRSCERWEVLIPEIKTIE